MNTPPLVRPGFDEALRFWTWLGFVSFGGPAGQIALMHEELVTRRRWIDEPRFLHALSFCTLLPGPEAQQLATYCGWLLHGTRGGIVAGALFVLPSVVLLWALSVVYALYGKVPLVAAVFDGLEPMVLAIVAHAVLRIGKKALPNRLAWGLAAAAFVLIYFAHVPFPLIVGGAAAIGFFGGRAYPVLFRTKDPHLSGDPAQDTVEAPPVQDPWARALRVVLVCGALWWAPVVACGVVFGWHSTFVGLGVFFSKAAMVTFGGAYAVLPYVAQQAVEHFGWLAPNHMIDGLALAETTPGPLIMVVQFVGFLGAFHHPGTLAPVVAGTLGALITTWVTFLPCFLWIFVGAPYVETLRQVASLRTALTAVTAAVVGVILNLAVWFGLHTLFPEGGGVNAFAAVVAVATFSGMVRWNWNLVKVVAAGALLGLARGLVMGG
ncbi:MAG: chromate efflux transporter [Deltaproteobacteria bacterium]|nr:chromate efflux transporter [Deltaproteobacteria bacterium]